MLSYWNTTFSNSISPLTFSLYNFLVNLLSSCISSSSKNSNTLSLAAPVDCSDVIACAICESGDVNSLTYVINATITPNEIIFFIVKIAPTIHTATYPKFPIKFIRGCINPDKN